MDEFEKWWNEIGYFEIGHVVTHGEAQLVWKAALDQRRDKNDGRTSGGN